MFRLRKSKVDLISMRRKLRFKACCRNPQRLDAVLQNQVKRVLKRRMADGKVEITNGADLKWSPGTACGVHTRWQWYG